LSGGQPHDGRHGSDSGDSAQFGEYFLEQAAHTEILVQRSGRRMSVHHQNAAAAVSELDAGERREPAE
jgi:hypothetical protein